MKITYNDGLESGGRSPRLVFVKNGEIIPFQGNSIPGVVCVLSTDYEKNGKWSNTTFRLEVAENIGYATVLSPLHQGFWDRKASWEEALSQFINMTSKNVSIETFKKWMLEAYPKASKRFDEIDVVLASIKSSDLSEPIEFTFGRPCNADIKKGFWTSPKNHGEITFRLKKEGMKWNGGGITPADIECPRAVIVGYTHSPGMHGGMVTILYRKV